MEKIDKLLKTSESKKKKLLEMALSQLKSVYSIQ